MIVVCPFCQTRFLVSAGLFDAGPRQVRCAKCRHGWKADAPPPENLTKEGVTMGVEVAPETPPPPPEAPATVYVPLITPVAGRILKSIGLLAVFCFLAWFVLNRQENARNMGFLEPVYNRIGLHIFHTGEGLLIKDVHSEQIYEEGIMKLVVEGKIVNTTGWEQQIPDIRASAIGPDGHEIQGWQIDAPAAKVVSGGEVPFHSAINAPKGTVVDISLNYVENIAHEPE